MKESIQVVGVDDDEQDRLRSLAAHALECALVWGVELPKMPLLPRGFVVYQSARVLAEALSLPERVSGGRAIARCNPATGVIYLSQGEGLSDRTVYYECGRYIFQDMSGLETGSRRMEEFADYCLQKAKEHT